LATESQLLLQNRIKPGETIIALNPRKFLTKHLRYLATGIPALLEFSNSLDTFDVRMRLPFQGD
jgi:hypothetical protein